MLVSKNSSVDQSELETQVVSDCIQYTVLEIQLWAVKCTTVTVPYAKILIHKSVKIYDITMQLC